MSKRFGSPSIGLLYRISVPREGDVLGGVHDLMQSIFLPCRVRSLAQATYSFVRMSVMFTLSVPGRIGRFMALSGAERREIYKGWWQATKKEAKHYWVSLSKAFCANQDG